MNPGESLSARLLLSDKPNQVSLKCRQLGLSVLARDGYDLTQPGAAGRVLYESLSQIALVRWYLRLVMSSYRLYWENEERTRALKQQ